MMGLRFPVASFLLLCATGKLVPSGTWFPVSSFGYMMGYRFSVAGFESRVLGLEGGAL